MKPDFYVDHHIQSSILGTLLQEGPKSFSTIKPDDLENSLFMYHMRKLITRGLVDRQEGNFRLTPEGSRWLNKTGLGRRAIEEPRCLVQFLAITNNSVLVSERLEHLAEHMNRFLLPGGLHKFGLTSQESAQTVSKALGIKVIGDVISQIETIIPSQSHHSIADIYLVPGLGKDFMFKDSFYKVSLKPIEEVLEMSTEESGILPMLLKKYLAKHLSLREEFEL